MKYLILIYLIYWNITKTNFLNSVSVLFFNYEFAVSSDGYHIYPIRSFGNVKVRYFSAIRKPHIVFSDL